MASKLLNQSVVSFPDRDWEFIKQNCKDRSGVYAFICKVNSRCYIGSAVDLYNRLRDYHQPWYLAKHTNDVIVRAITKHGIESFTIAILEYTTPEKAVAAEQVWINTYKPEYNVLKKAGSSLGYVHSDENKLKISETMTGKPRSQKVRTDISKRQLGSNNSFFGKTHTEQSKALIRAAAVARNSLPKLGFSITVIDTLTNTETAYNSLRTLAKELNSSRSTLQKYNGLLFRERYIIRINNKTDK